MADNIAITAGSGTTVAADDIGGTYHQRVKVSIGSDGEAADLDHGQALMAASIPVVIASNQSVIPVSDNSSTLSVDDGGGALTVDGSVSITGSVAVTDNSSTLSVDDGAGSLTVDGSIGIDRKTFTYYTGTKSSSGDNTVIAAPGLNTRIVVEAIEVQNTTVNATTVILKDGSTSIWTRYLGLQGDSLAFQWQRGSEWLLTANTALVVSLSGANAHYVNIKYYTEAT